MADQTYRTRWPMRRWRALGWGSALALLAAPLLAMRFTDEVDWSAADFAVAAALFASCGSAFELAARSSRDRHYRAGAAVALATGLLVVWVNLAVGIVGSEDEPFNLVFFVAPVVALVFAAAGRGRAAGMVHAMLAAAAAQLLAGALVRPAAPEAMTLATLLVTAPWLLAAALFRRAVRRPGPDAARG